MKSLVIGLGLVAAIATGAQADRSQWEPADVQCPDYEVINLLRDDVRATLVSGHESWLNEMGCVVYEDASVEPYALWQMKVANAGK